MPSIVYVPGTANGIGTTSFALQPPSPNAPTPAASAYQQAAQAGLNGQPLDPLAQADGQSSAHSQPPAAGPGAASGHHHDHHGGHSKLSAGTLQTVQSAFEQLTSALGGSRSAQTDTTTPTPAHRQKANGH